MYRYRHATALAIVCSRDAKKYIYIAYRIVLRQYRCIDTKFFYSIFLFFLNLFKFLFISFLFLFFYFFDTKSNRNYISRIVIYRHIVAC